MSLQIKTAKYDIFYLSALQALVLLFLLHIKL